MATKVKPDMEWLANAKSNANEIERDLDELLRNHFKHNTFDFNEFRDDAKQIAYKFKNFILTKRDRDDLWNRYDQLWEDAKKENKAQWQKVKTFSKNLRNQIIEQINAVKELAETAENKDDMEDVQRRLDEAFDWFKEGFEKIEPFKESYESFGKQAKLLHADRQKAWKELQKIKDFVNQKRTTFYEENLKNLSKQADKALESSRKGDPYETLEEIKRVQNRMKDAWLGWNQKEKIRKRLNTAWDKAIERIEKRKEERKRKHQQWKRRMKAKVSEFEKDIQENEKSIAELEDQIEKLRDDIESATSPSFMERARGWILLKEAKIRDLKRTNDELEGKLEEIKEDVAS